MATSSANTEFSKSTKGKEFENTVILSPNKANAEKQAAINLNKKPDVPSALDSSIDELVEQIDSMVEEENKLIETALLEKKKKLEKINNDYENKDKDAKKVIPITDKKDTFIQELKQAVSKKKLEKEIADRENKSKDKNIPKQKFATEKLPVQGKFITTKKTSGSRSTKNEELTDDVNTATTDKPIGKVQILSGSNLGKELILDKSLTTLGKPNVAVVGVTKRNAGYFIVHLENNEDNIPKLNGDPIPSKATKLDEHDIIEVAGTKLEFFIE